MIPGGGDLAARRGDYVFGGMLALAALLMLLLAIDGYTFYVSHLRERTAATPFRRSASLVPGDIDAVLRILDERGQKLEALLSGGEDKNGTPPGGIEPSPR